MKLTQQRIPNAFAPLELDLLHKGAFVTISTAHPLHLPAIDPAHPLLLIETGHQHVLGMRGMEVREGSL